MAGQQFSDVLCGRLVVFLDGVQDRGDLPGVFPVLGRLHHERDDTGRLHRRGDADGGLLVEQQRPLETDVADFGCLAQHRVGHGQRHLAVGSPRQGGRVVDLVIGQPGQRVGADPTLPDVAFRLLGQAHVCAHQGVRRNRRAPRPRIPALAGQEQRTLSPRRQRRVHQAPGGVEHREVHRGTRAVQVAQQGAQPVRQRLFAPHAASAAAGMSRLRAV